MKDLSIMVEDGIKLNVRTTGAFVKKGKILVNATHGDEHYSLPGGRVKSNEDSISALEREVQEEMQLEIENIKPIGIIENFFDTPNARYHEYMWLFDAEFVDKSIYDKEEIIAHEGEKEMLFKWLDITELEKADFRPSIALKYIKEYDGNMKHIINVDKH